MIKKLLDNQLDMVNGARVPKSKRLIARPSLRKLAFDKHCGLDFRQSL
jgi:hypothetical protein